METKIIKINLTSPERDKIRIAAKTIRGGSLVAFPTETVYGLGANALDEKAVSKIFIAKGRPQDNPLIVHISNKKQIKELAKEIPSVAQKLIDKFWPGPLTIILKKKNIVPYNVTAGLETVAIRMPKNKIALSLITESGCPIAAPSANLSGKPSPTNAEHVFEDLNGRIPIIINGGKTEIGIESTVIDLSTKFPKILRPGKITCEQIQKIIGKTDKSKKEIIAKSPGMRYKHYSPNAEIIIVKDNSKLQETRRKYENAGKTKIIFQNKNPLFIAQNLFYEFRLADKQGVKTIIIPSIKKQGLGTAIMNRIEKAATKIIH